MFLNKTKQNKTIVAVLPTCNEEGKNVCKVIFQDGNEQIQDISTEKFMENWYWEYELLNYRLEYEPGKYEKIARVDPLTLISLRDNIILVQIKCKEAKKSGDEIYGYIRHDVFKYKENDVIGLVNNIEVPCLSSIDRIEKDLDFAEEIELMIKANFDL